VGGWILCPDENEEEAMNDKIEMSTEEPKCEMIAPKEPKDDDEASPPVSSYVRACLKVSLDGDVSVHSLGKGKGSLLSIPKPRTNTFLNKVKKRLALSLTLKPPSGGITYPKCTTVLISRTITVIMLLSHEMF
jgi:hypothetical protein